MSSIPGTGGLLRRFIYLATVVCPTSIPSLSSSPWIRGAPHNGLATLISRIRVRISKGVFGRPAARSGFPAPERAKSSPMPADHRLRLDNRQGIQGAGRQAIQPHKEQPISVAEDQPFRSFPSQHVELVAQGDDFRLQISPRSEEICNRAPDQSENVDHRPKASPNIGPLASRIRFAVGTAVNPPVAPGIE